MAAISTLQAEGAPAETAPASYKSLPNELKLGILLYTLTIDDPTPSEAVRRAGSLRLLSKASSDNFLQACKDYVSATASPSIMIKCVHYKEAPLLSPEEHELAVEQHIDRMRELHGPCAMWDPENEFNPFAETASHPFVCSSPTCQRLVADSQRIGARSINNPGSSTAISNLAALHTAFLEGKKHNYIYIKPSVAALLAREYRRDNQGARPSYLGAVSSLHKFIEMATCGLSDAPRCWRYCERTRKLDMLDSEDALPCTQTAQEEGYSHRILDLEKYRGTSRDYPKAWGKAPEYRHHVSVCCSGETFDASLQPTMREDGTLQPACRVSNELGDRCECAACPVRWRNDWPNDEAEDRDGEDDECSGEGAEEGQEGVWAVDEMVWVGLI